jgi:hypothetical protein
MQSKSDFVFAVVATAISIIFTVVVSEVMLQIAARMFPRVDAILFPFIGNDVLPDAELGHKGNPKFPERDANGFRNTTIPKTTDIVAIGDSHTYGANVADDQAWPRVLERLTSCRVYSMALGAYGPLQYAILAEKAVRFKPRQIVVGIYFGNDFVDNWEMYLRNPESYPVRKELVDRAIEKDRQVSLQDLTRNLYLESPRQESERAWSVSSFLSRHSSLWGFGRAIKRTLYPSGNSTLSDGFQTAVAALTPTQLEYASIFEGADWRTILTSPYRAALENRDDPRVEVGVWLTQWAIQKINETAKRNGIATIFILLPTKESVFVDKVKSKEEHKLFKKLTLDEDRNRQVLIAYMEENHIAYIDMAPFLRSMTHQPYFENADGHPNAVGHEAIAMRLREYVETCKH